MPIGPLRGRSAGELVTRGRQALAVRAERWGVRPPHAPDGRALARLLELPAAGGPSVGARLRTRLRAGAAPRPFAGLADRGATVAAIRRLAPDAERSAVARADAVLAGRFDLLGLRALSFGDPVDWALDPVSGRRAPDVHWSRVPYLDAAIVGDHKIVWELNRHTFLYTLGRAYWLTGDERYARRAVELIEQWMAANPPKRGINWASSLEVSFRAIAWVWALHLFRESPALSDRTVERMYAFLHVHGRHLEQHLSTYFSPNTHLTGEALGLLYLGVALPEFRCAGRWRRAGWSILERELGRHVTADGVYFERASYYHRYTIDFYAHALLLVGRTEPDASDPMARALGALLRHLRQLGRGDGTFALVGDDDGGRLAHLDDAPVDDCRPALSTGSALLRDATLKWSAGGVAEETVWLLGPARAGEWAGVAARVPETLSAAYPDGGYCVLRDGWEPGANRLLLDCGPHGALTYGHAHDDALSLDVAVDGVALLADPGTFSYVEPTDRDYFRGARAHSTVVVAGERGPSLPSGPFRWTRATHAELRRWATGPRLDVAEAARPAEGVAVPGLRRAVVNVRGAYWIVVDRPQGDGQAEVEMHYHAAAGVGAVGTADGARLRSAGSGATLRIAAAADALRVTIGSGWTSRAYAARERCAHVCVGATVSAARPAMTALLPTAAANAVVEAVAAEGGAAIGVRYAAGADTLLVGERPSVRAAGIETDARWCWVRREAATGRVLAWALVDGSRLSADGVPLLEASARREYAEGAADRPCVGAAGERERTMTRI